ncbi:MAG TPA: L,D-transpeptidase family protein [Gaiellaceae bacterium]|nr:L,D-transpeptidase family protein [Gaiellaceae bacterium]
MRLKVVLFLVAFVAMLGGGAGALYAYDASREELIADGVTVAGVAVGGMTVAEASAAVRREVVSRLRRPLVVEHDGRGVVLVAARRLGVRVDVDGMAREALRESRRGSFLERAFRELTGDTLAAAIPLRVSYSERAVSDLVSRVQRRLERNPSDARVFPSSSSIRLVASRNGLAVRTRRLERVIASRLVAPGSDRRVDVPTRVLKPKTTTAELRSRYRTFIAVSRPRFELRLFVGLRLAKTYRISVGRIGYDTPSGLYRIKNKAENPSWWVPNEPWAGDLAGKVIPPGPDNPIKARWLGIYDGAGIHGTADVGSIGSRASHGCIRMLIPDVVELSDRVPVGTPVFIG